MRETSDGGDNETTLMNLLDRDAEDNDIGNEDTLVIVLDSGEEDTK